MTTAPTDDIIIPPLRRFLDWQTPSGPEILRPANVDPSMVAAVLHLVYAIVLQLRCRRLAVDDETRAASDRQIDEWLDSLDELLEKIWSSHGEPDDGPQHAEN